MIIIPEKLLAHLIAAFWVAACPCFASFAQEPEPFFDKKTEIKVDKTQKFEPHLGLTEGLIRLCPIGKSASTSCRDGKEITSDAIIIAIYKDTKRQGIPVGVLWSHYWYCHDGTGEVYRVPAGFETDFLSIPKLARYFIRPRDYIEAAVIHDWLYAVGEPGRRQHADSVFRDALEELGATALVRNTMYNIVRAFGERWYRYEKAWRFVDPKTRELIQPPPIVRPQVAAIMTVKDCSNFVPPDESR